MAVRAANRLDNASDARKIVIGEDMAGRVIPEAKRLGADYHDPPNMPPDQWMDANRKWINDRMDEGCTIINCGPAPGARTTRTRRARTTRWSSMRSDAATTR